MQAKNRVYRYIGTKSSHMVAGHSAPVVIAPDCGVRGPRFESHHRRLCLLRWLLQYAALGMGCIFTAVPRSTQPCIPSALSTSFGWGKGGNVTSAG